MRARTSRFAPRVRALGLGALLALAGCADDPLVYDLRVVSPSGGAPLAGTDVATLFVHFGQGSLPVTVTESAVSDGAFDASLPLGDANATTFVGLDFVGAADHLLGALPLHTPAEARLAATLVVGPAGSCAPLAGFELAAPAAGVGGAAVGTYGLLVGGEESAGAGARVAYLDLLRASGGTLGDAASALGPTKAAAVTRDIALVLPAASAAFFYDLGNASDPFLPVTVHEGASEGGALVAAGALGAAVVGGALVGAPVAGLTFVGSDGVATASSLVRARRGAAAAFDGARLWVAAGDGTNASSLELAPFEGVSGVAIDDLADGVRIGAHLFVSDDGAQALLLGGEDALGVTRADTVWIHGCPAACVAEPGPAWTSARAGTVALPAERLVVGGEGAGLVERVDFLAGGPAIVARGALDIPRRDPAAIPLAAGVFVVVGGDDGAGPRRDAEICFPDALPAVAAP